MTGLSPLANLAKLDKLKLLHFQGGRDTTTYPEDNQQFVSDMSRVNPNYSFVALPNAGHGLTSARGPYRAITEQFLGECLGVPVEPMNPDELAAMSKLAITGGGAFLPSSDAGHGGR
jgi:hypothetical protein